MEEEETAEEMMDEEKTPKEEEEFRSPIFEPALQPIHDNIEQKIQVPEMAEKD